MKASRRTTALLFWASLIVLLVAFALTAVLLRDRMGRSGPSDLNANGGLEGTNTESGGSNSSGTTGTSTTGGSIVGNNTGSGDNGSEDMTDGGITVIDPVTPQDVIVNARAQLESMIDQNHRLSPMFVRLGFHDCIGGCDGCVDLDHVDNRGLAETIDILRPVVSQFEVHGVTRADIWALAATTGADVAQGRQRVDFVFDTYGRVSCEDTNTPCLNEMLEEVPCDETHGPHRPFPSPDLTTHDVLQFFEDEFGFTMEETVAIMGAHTLGKLRRENSGFEGRSGWVRREDILDNEYYEGLVGGDSVNDSMEELLDAPNWHQRRIDNSDIIDIPDRFQWNRGGGRGGRRLGRGGGSGRSGSGRSGGGRGGGGGDNDIMLNADISLVRDMEGYMDDDGEVSCEFEENGNDPVDSVVCPAAHTLPQMALYRHNNLVWLQDFQAVLGKMLISGYSRDECTSTPCKLSPPSPF